MNLAAQLTKREEQIITGIVLGRCKKEIASELNISVRTAENQTRSAMIKTEVNKSTDLVAYWFIKRFSIPVEALPTSITAMIFLLLWIPSEFLMHSNTLRNRIPTGREKTEEVTRSKRAEESNDFTIEL